MIIRQSTPEDLAALEAIYPAAFPDEDLLPLVRSLETNEPRVLSLVAVNDGEVLGHAAFTFCTAGQSETPLAMLAPLCVAPNHHKQGLGSALVKEGFDRLKAQSVEKVLVLGDPAYYSRFGFSQENDIQTPYPLPEEWAQAWQSVSLGPALRVASGSLNLPPVWMDPALWSA
ncbi:GNAT family N-acetyltransferase [Labrenzia sp. PHM005]|uniref:GNAT family N-acetyltransferase n=1 Tax=Labrenzia sp. PHM005 TaxID=2590016 RepID=UPI00143CCF58|nr:N-acetyltransferase [Labrenzia sp. PHM005]